MRSSYRPEDVTLLLKDITGMVEPQSTEEREKLIQAGRHYCEMLPMEYVPTERYMQVYREALEAYAETTAHAVGKLADRIREERGKEVVLVSLARAGIPIGILVKHYLQKKYRTETPHYAISIIRGKGIDDNAMRYLLERYRPEQLLFVDGWVGKGAILGQLEKAIRQYPGVSPQLAVVADPAYVTRLCGTHEDILIASSCLNSTVSGLVSRTFLREDVIGKEDFHGAVYYENLKDSDLSYEFLEAIEKHFVIENTPKDCESKLPAQGWERGLDKSAKSLEREEVREAFWTADGFLESRGFREVRRIAEDFGIRDMHLIKPGIGETTRVLLRRVPWKVLIDARHRGAFELAHIERLAEEKCVPVEYYPLTNYKCCGLIKQMADT